MRRGEKPLPPLPQAKQGECSYSFEVLSKRALRGVPQCMPNCGSGHVPMTQHVLNILCSLALTCFIFKVILKQMASTAVLTGEGEPNCGLVLKLFL